MDEQLESLVRTPEMTSVDELLLGPSVSSSALHQYQGSMQPSRGAFSYQSDGWQRKYFFVRVSPSSVYDPFAVFRTDWNPQPVFHERHWPLSPSASERLEKIRASVRPSWNDFGIDRVHRSIPRINIGSQETSDSMRLLVPESSKRKREASPKKRGKVKRKIPEYSDVIKETAPGFSFRDPKEGASSLAPPSGSSFTSDVAPLTTSAVPSSGVVEIKSSLMAPSGLSDPEPLAVLSPMVSPHSPDAPPVAKEVFEMAIGDQAGLIVSRGGEGGVRVFPKNSSSLLISPEDYARLFSGLCPPSGSALVPEELVFPQSYVEWASLEAQSKIRCNVMIDQYNRRCMRLCEDLEVERRALAVEKERLSRLSSSLDALKESSGELESVNRRLSAEAARLREEASEREHREEMLLDQKAALETEVSHLTESRQRLLSLERERVTSVLSSLFGSFVDKVRAYLSNHNRVRPQILAENQLTGVVSCLERYISEGISIPAEQLAENKHALMLKTAALDEMVVHELEMEDLPLLPLAIDKEMKEIEE
ncbi:hypothetical protein Bca52824_032635 [Brassica carinata]|uniref:Uncharacterized protein n=1 Tax=Brassica carinata TaxID=52824 RepID=A0A8X7SH93_BRACI|nr:hypothetical protein Bca52824_032635 [Brassica carinata]